MQPHAHIYVYLCIFIYVYLHTCIYIRIQLSICPPICLCINRFITSSRAFQTCSPIPSAPPPSYLYVYRSFYVYIDASPRGLPLVYLSIRLSPRAASFKCGVPSPLRRPPAGGRSPRVNPLYIYIQLSYLPFYT